MKRVSFKIAKAIKDAGYPQGTENTAYYNEEGMLIKPNVFNLGKEIADAPYIMEVWLWLWREKRKCIEIIFSEDEDGWTFMQNPSPCNCGLYQDPEDATIAAIDYIIDNNIIK